MHQFLGRDCSGRCAAVSSRLAMVSLRFFGDAVLVKNTSAPTSEESWATACESCTDTTTIFVPGDCSRIRRAASMPLIFGMMASMMTRSGLSRWTFSRASLPSVASPQISHSGTCSSKLLIPVRDNSWSSTRSIRAGIVLTHPFKSFEKVRLREHSLFSYRVNIVRSRSPRLPTRQIVSYLRWFASARGRHAGCCLWLVLERSEPRCLQHDRSFVGDHPLDEIQPVPQQSI